MSGRPRVAVVIATHDRPQFIGDCMRSAAAALGPEDALVVVESGRANAAAEVAASLDVPVAVHRCSAREKTVKMNDAIRRTEAEVVLFTDDDCRFEPGWARAMGAPFESPSVGMAFGPVAGISGAPGGAPLPLLLPGPAPLQPWAFAHGPSMAVRRDAALAVGGFDERLGPGARCHGEEADMLLRLRERGWRCVIADAPAVRHVEWRDEDQDAANYAVYSRGAGGYIGAALRRAPRANAKLFVLTIAHELELWRDRAAAHPAFGPRNMAAFAGGVAFGARMAPRRFL